MKFKHGGYKNSILSYIDSKCAQSTPVTVPKIPLKILNPSSIISIPREIHTLHAKYLFISHILKIVSWWNANKTRAPVRMHFPYLWIKSLKKFSFNSFLNPKECILCYGKYSIFKMHKHRHTEEMQKRGGMRQKKDCIIFL